MFIEGRENESRAHGTDDVRVACIARQGDRVSQRAGRKGHRGGLARSWARQRGRARAGDAPGSVMLMTETLKNLPQEVPRSVLSEGESRG